MPVTLKVVENFCNHDDVMDWKHFSRYGPLCGDFTGHRWNALTKASNVEFWCFFYMRMNKRLSKESRRRLFETPSRFLWHHCNALENYYKTQIYVCYHKPNMQCQSVCLTLVHSLLLVNLLVDKNQASVTLKRVQLSCVAKNRTGEMFVFNTVLGRKKIHVNVLWATLYEKHISKGVKHQQIAALGHKRVHLILTFIM